MIIKVRIFSVTRAADSVVAANGSLSIIDNDQVQFSMLPRSRCWGELVLMVLSAPGNVIKRDGMRERTRRMEDVQLIFLLGTAEKYQTQLEAEQRVHDDIVQATVPDSYDTLSYKSLFGFLWIYLKCSEARYIIKTDDDVSLDLENIKNTLEWKYGSLSVPDIMECPSVIRNMRPLKQRHSGTIMGKFFISSQELQRRVYPDVCFGWLYVTTPR